MSAPSPTAGPAQVANYRIVAELGRGSMGTVYEAVHEVTEAHVALKLLHPRPEDPTFDERFLREARAAARIDHPGVARVQDAGSTDDGLLYMVMELLEGESLEVYFGKHRATYLQGIGWLCNALEPLAAAHAVGYVHRDLKPENIFLARTPGSAPTVKLLDFGIAEEVAQTEGSGAIMGTPDYMSPEQCTSQPVGPQGDVWAVGAMLYEWLSGRPPFVGESPAHVLNAVCNRTHEPLQSAAPEAPAELCALVERCLQKDPAQRPADAQVLLSQLRPVWLSADAQSPLAAMRDPQQRASAQSTAVAMLPTHPVQQRRRPVALWWWAAAAALMLGALWMWRPRPAPAPAARPAPLAAPAARPAPLAAPAARPAPAPAARPAPGSPRRTGPTVQQLPVPPPEMAEPVVAKRPAAVPPPATEPSEASLERAAARRGSRARPPRNRRSAEPAVRALEPRVAAERPEDIAAVPSAPAQPTAPVAEVETAPAARPASAAPPQPLQRAQAGTPAPAPTQPAAAAAAPRETPAPKPRPVAAPEPTQPVVPKKKKKAPVPFSF